jgi:hypothetical protein
MKKKVVNFYIDIIIEKMRLERVVRKMGRCALEGPSGYSL